MPINEGPVTQGVDFNFFETIAVGKTEFSIAGDGYVADVFFRFKGAVKTIILTVEGGNPIEYSFNGNTLHGDLTPTTDTSHLVFQNRPVSKIWFRAPSGASSVRVEAWSTSGL